jgi:flagellar export protein FliJ
VLPFPPMAEYRFQTLLELRARARDAAEQAFARAVRDLAAARKRLQELEWDLRHRKEERKRKVGTFVQEVMKKGAGAAGFDQMHRFEERLKEEEAQVALEIDRQKEMVERAAREVEVKRHEMGEAAKELRAIERHKENWTKRLRLEMQAREELSQEEVGNALHLMRTRK